MFPYSLGFHVEQEEASSDIALPAGQKALQKALFSIYFIMQSEEHIFPSLWNCQKMYWLLSHY